MRAFRLSSALIISIAIALALAIPTSRNAVADAFLRIAPFPTLITRPVIKAAVGGFVKNVQQWREWQSDGNSYAVEHPEALTAFANDSARFAVWDAQFTNPDDQSPHTGTNRVGCSYGYDGCAGMPKEPKLARWRRDLSELARAYLRNPDRLHALYRVHRDEVLEEIRALHAHVEVREYLHSVLPYFLGPPSAELHRVEVLYQLARQRAMVAMDGCVCAENWARGIGDAETDCSECKTVNAEFNAYRQSQLDTYKAAQAKLARIAPDWKAFQWANRRRTEGGQRLVNAWATIITDLARNL